MISKKPLKVSLEIYEVFIIDGIDHFTIHQFRDKYVDKSGMEDPEKAKKIVYRQILRLYKLQMLSKELPTEKGKPIYHKTELFDEIGIVPKIDGIYPTTEVSILKNTKHLLEQRLDKCEEELVKCNAESAEYLSLYKEIPELKRVLELNYKRSKKYSSILSGQITAIKTLIENKHKTNKV